ncbi:MAG: hypothetical protein PVH41_18400, partial [Anaerolineae bacterium]
MEIESEVQNTDTKELYAKVLRLNASALGLVLGLLCGISLFIATNWLVIKGGDPVGPHLALLSQYFIGYRVSFVGSLIGFLYAFVIGGLGGVLIGWIYNRALHL